MPNYLVTKLGIETNHYSSMAESDDPQEVLLCNEAYSYEQEVSNSYENLDTLIIKVKDEHDEQLAIQAMGLPPCPRCNREVWLDRYGPFCPHCKLRLWPIVRPEVTLTELNGPDVKPIPEMVLDD